MADPELIERKRVVSRYFTEVLDGGAVTALGELFTPDVVQRFPGATIKGLDGSIAVLCGIQAVFSSFKTTIHSIFGEGDRLAAHVSHDVVTREVMPTRLGAYLAPAKAIRWDAIAVFRFEGNRIAEEWIARDDLGVLLQLGTVNVATESSAALE